MDGITIAPYIIYLAGTFLVVLFAASYFNNPEYEPSDQYIRDVVLEQEPKMSPVLPKYVAEKTRYRIHLISFIFITVILYCLASLIFPLLFTVMYPGGKEVVVEYAPAFALGTLAFIAASPKLPFIKEILTKWKNDLHRRAKIPDKAMYVFDSMRYSEINKSSDQFLKNLDAILNSKIAGEIRSDIEKDYFYFDKSRIERKWARLTYLMHAIEQWSKNSQFERHLKSESLKWLALRAYYMDKLVPEMRRYKQGELNENEVEATKNNIDKMAIKIYWLVTLLLFMANKAEEDPCIHLKRIGWIVDPDKYFRFSNKQVIFTGAVTFFAIVIGAVVGGLFLLGISRTEIAQGYEIDPKKFFIWILFGIPMFTVPLVTTMFAKRMLSMDGTWAVQRPEQPALSFFRRPWEIYFPVGIVSYAITFASLLVLYTLYVIFGNPDASGHTLALALYSSLVFVTSLFISYLIDPPDPEWGTNWRYYLKNLAPAIFQGLVNVSLLSFVFLIFNGSKFNPLSLAHDKLGQLIVYNVIVFTIGIAINYTSRIGTKFYERRENGVVRSTEGWWTVLIDSVTKRVETVTLPGNSLDIIADAELQQVSDVGDAVEFYTRDKLAMTGKVEEIHDNLIRVSLPI